MTSEPAKTRRRVFVAIDDTSQSEAVIDTAALLAASLSAELNGILVEPQDLLDAASLPMTSIVSFHGEAVAPYDLLSLKRSLRLRARKIEMQFAQLAERLNIPWQFSIGESGSLGDRIKTMTQGDIVAVGLSRKGQRSSTTMLAPTSIAGGTNCSVLVIRKARVAPGSVAVVSSRPADDMGLGLSLAQAKGRALYILPVTPKSGPQTSSDTPPALPAALAPQARPLPAVAVEGVLDTLSRLTPAYLVIERATLRALNMTPGEVTDRLALDGLIVTGSAAQTSS